MIGNLRTTGFGAYHFQQISVGVSFIDGGKRSAQRKPRTCHKLLANFIT
jgi:hypothetical protein